MFKSNNHSLRKIPTVHWLLIKGLSQPYSPVASYHDNDGMRSAPGSARSSPILGKTKSRGEHCCCLGMCMWSGLINSKEESIWYLVIYPPPPPPSEISAYMTLFLWNSGEVIWCVYVCVCVCVYFDLWTFTLCTYIQPLFSLRQSWRKYLIPCVCGFAQCLSGLSRRWVGLRTSLRLTRRHSSDELLQNLSCWDLLEDPLLMMVSLHLSVCLSFILSLHPSRYMDVTVYCVLVMWIGAQLPPLRWHCKCLLPLGSKLSSSIRVCCCNLATIVF